MVLELTPENFGDNVLTANKPVLVDFWAPWCAPCRMMAPIFEKVSKEYTGKLHFGKINVQDYQEIAEQFGIQGIPALLMFNHGEVVGDIVGAMSETRLKSEIDILLKKI